MPVTEMIEATEVTATTIEIRSGRRSSPSPKTASTPEPTSTKTKKSILFWEGTRPWKCESGKKKSRRTARPPLPLSTRKSK